MTTECAPAHTTVLLHETVDAVLTNPDGVYVDATYGRGGHSRLLLSKLSPQGRLIGFDRDPQAVADATELALADPRFSIRHAAFSGISELQSNSLTGLLMDLGVSSPQIDESARGFSFMRDGPLDMRFNRHDTVVPPASNWIMRVDERTLCKGLQDYADEPKAYFIARAIVVAREKSPITTTMALAQIIEDASFDPKSVLRSFQAIRIMVNGEFAAIEDSIPQAVRALAPGGRLVMITFHSGEDRLVKTRVRVHETPETDELTGCIVTPATIKKVTKKPVEPTPEEISHNPRSRSAKLRIYEKI